MRVLAIGQIKRDEIKKAIERAKANPTSIEDAMRLAKSVDQRSHTVTLDQRPEGFRPRSQFVEIPHGFRAAISFESQPAGLCRHLSVSVDKKGKCPSPQAVKMICEEFGFTSFPPSAGRIWLEEFEPGHQAVNVVQVEPT